MSPREIDDVKNFFFLRKFVRSGLGQHACQVLSFKYYAFRNQPFKSPVLIGLTKIFKEISAFSVFKIYVVVLCFL